MDFAEVCVNSPVKQPRTFSYKIPQALAVETGDAVWVPFGPRVLQGIVFGLTELPQVESTREIIGLIESQPLLTPVQVELARWVSSYYLSSLFSSCSLMLPPGFERRIVTVVKSVEGIATEKVSSLSPDEVDVMGLVTEHGQMGMKELEKVFGKKKAHSCVQSLVGWGILSKQDTLGKVRVRPKKEKFVKLNVELKDAQAFIARWENNSRYLQRILLLRLLVNEGKPLPVSEVKRKIGQVSSSLQTLEKSGMVAVEEIEVARDPLATFSPGPSVPHVLTAYQAEAWQKLQEAIQTSGKAAHEIGNYPKPFLLHGVTGSGKTEIYLRAVEKTIEMGKKAIVLVPEIALTTQTISRFISRFPGRVAVLHSRLSVGEQYDEWWRIKRGLCDIVIGPRSAIFAPQPDLGLIVIDEEHEWTYKQKETQPYYHARDVALKLAELTGSVLVMGSATPDVSTYNLALSGQYQLLELPERVSYAMLVSHPPVKVVDMRRELREGNRSIFSRELNYSIKQALSNGDQVILFINRRGAFTFVHCGDCGFHMRCRRCEVSLVYHRDEDRLVCHQCNYRLKVPAFCPECNGKKIRFSGLGTQRVEQEAREIFRGARLLRWDRDVTRKSHAHQDIMEKFLGREADILIGTQMIAKGLDIPSVNLVGVINADTGLSLADFRAAERTFQLLTQVSGRAGRGAKEGKVVIQTFNPQHYAIEAAARHDYKAFYEKELIYRNRFNYPPFTRLATLSYTHINQSKCKIEVERIANLVRTEAARAGITDVVILGPTPAFIARKKGKYRWQLVVMGKEFHFLLANLILPSGWSINIDPLGVD